MGEDDFMMGNGHHRAAAWGGGLAAAVSVTFAILAGFVPDLVPSGWLEAHRAVMWLMIGMFALLAIAIAVWSLPSRNGDSGSGSAVQNEPGFQSVTSNTVRGAVQR